jgi:hypothetical protein
MRACLIARHSQAAFRGKNGKAAYRVEVLWDSEVRGLGLRLLPSGRKTRRALFELAEGEDPFVRREPGKMLRALEGEFTEACRRRVAAEAEGVGDHRDGAEAHPALAIIGERRRPKAG